MDLEQKSKYMVSNEKSNYVLSQIDKSIKSKVFFFYSLHVPKNFVRYTMQRIIRQKNM